ncbi:MAG: AsmA-like C-terminal region-containing protein [Albidovulum sp.]
MDGNPDQPQETPVRPARTRRHGGMWVLLTLSLLVALLGIAALGITGRTINAPDWLVDRVEARANAALSGRATLAIGGVEVLVDAGFVPHIRMRDVELFSSGGRRIAVLPDLRTTLHAKPILHGRIEPRYLRITGAQIKLLRFTDGSLDVATGETNSIGTGSAGSIVELLKSIDDVFELPVLSGIETISVDDLDLQLIDLRAGKRWNASQSRLSLRQDHERVYVDMEFALAEAGRRAARAELNFATVKGSPEAKLTAKVTDVLARDLAAQSAALAWLNVLDAPISGAISSGVDGAGNIEELVATLELGAGALQPTPDTNPVGFDAVRLGLRFDPVTSLLTLSEIAIESAALRVNAQGKAWLKKMTGGVPGELIGQVEITKLSADPEGLFADPVSFTQGAVDLRLELNPFRLRLGQLVLVDGDRRISAKGTVSAESDGWAVAVDVAMDAIASDRLLALWPVSVVPLTRKWLEENVATSELFNAEAAFRLRPGDDPHFALGYEYKSTEVRILRTLPPVQDGAGYAVINDYSYTLVVDKGHVTAPAGGDVDVAGSVLSIADLRIKPAPAVVHLHTQSDITAALSLLDQAPFQFLTKAGLPVDIADGDARVDATLGIVLAAKVKPEDVSYQVSAKLLDVHSDRIVPGRILGADALDLVADRQGIRISGPGTVSGVPVNVSWSQSFFPKDKGRSRVEGSIELSPRFLDSFGIGLPKGAVTGTGSGKIVLELEKGKETSFTLTSDLVGVGLAVPEIAWRKAADTAGRLLVRGRLGRPVSIDRLELEGAGLSVGGKVLISADGELDRALLGRASIGGWFDGTVELSGRGKGRTVGVTVTAGRADMRKASFGGGTGDGPVSITLDRLTVSEGIALTGFQGNFTSRGGFSGEFTANLNGQTAIRGTVAPFGSRSGFRIRSTDAGGVMRAAGIFERGVGGTLDMTMRPAEQTGNYDGTVDIGDIRVVDAPVLAGMLDAISVVGLLNQLSGPGLLFSSVTGDFRLTPTAVEVRRGAAVGASLGISADGVVETAAGRVDLRGTISPIYVLNGIGQIFSKKGEGLFGFSYKLSGPVDSPKVSVNPLSILTPGMFREIFRSNPPKLAP